MILEKLTIEGFKAISHPMTVHFPRNAIIGVIGPNETGKSTFLESIEFALFGPPMSEETNTDEDLITWGKNNAKVTLDVSVEQQRYRVQRRITKGGSQTVRLSRIADESPDFEGSGSGAIEGVSDVAKEIETILGFDKSAFTKLLSIDQKGLDVAFHTERLDRVLLVNKLFGCESFDLAIARVRKDRELLQTEHVAMEKEMQTIANNKKTFERRLAEKQELECMLSDSSPELASTQGQLDDLRSKLESFRWRLKFDSLNNQLASERQNLAEITNQPQELSTKQADMSRYETTFNKYKGESDRLSELLVLFKDAEDTRSRADQRLQELRKNVDRKKDELSAGELALLAKEENSSSASIVKQQKSTLGGLILSLAIGGGIITLSIFTNPIYFIACIAVLGISVLLVKRYETIDMYILDNKNLRSLTQEIRRVKEELNSLDSKHVTLIMNNGVGTSGQIAELLSLISQQIEDETGAKSIDDLYSLIGSVKEETAKMLVNGSDKGLGETKNRIRLFERQIEDLDAEKPQGTDHHLAHGDGELKALQEQYVVQTTNSKMLESRIRDGKAVLNHVYEDLKSLKADHDEFPVLQSKLEQAKHELQLLDRIEQELSQTDEEIRKGNFPTFSLLVNTILPLVGSRNYSNFEDSNNFTFGVVSQASGKYEELNVYSNGVQDQFWLILRLAFAQLVLKSINRKDKPCILLDDVLSTSDAEKKRAIFQVLRAMQTTAFSQIIIASHEEIGDYLDYTVVLTKNEEGFTRLNGNVYASDAR